MRRMKSREYVGPLVVEQREDGNRDLLDVLRLATPGGVDEALVEGQVLDPLRPFLRVDDLGKEVRVPPLGVHVRDRQEAVEVVEAHVLGLRLHVLADVPLAHRLGHVAGLAQQRGQRDLAVEAARLAVHRWAQQAVAHGQPAGHQRCPRRCARGLGVAGRQQQAPPGQPVDVGGRGPDRHPAAVAAEVAPADVVEEDHQDVRASPVPPGRRRGRSWPGPPGRGGRTAAPGSRPLDVVVATTGSWAIGSPSSSTGPW